MPPDNTHHKKEDKANVDNWRPITIGNLILRVYAKCWDIRLRLNVSLNMRQKAFTPVDGCFENIPYFLELVKVVMNKTATS